MKLSIIPVNKLLILIYLAFQPAIHSIAQMTFELHLNGQAAKLDSVPSLLPIFVAGDFNDWNPASPAHQMRKNSDGSYSLSTDLSTGRYAYKYTRGDWATVEVNADGTDRPNRTVSHSAGVWLKDTVALFRDQMPSGPPPPLNDAIVKHSIFIPQLNRHRTIRVYLPPMYETSSDHFAVMYMHDGQNLYDDATAYAGEWGVDESLDSLCAPGSAYNMEPLIVIGIDNSAFRFSEYSFEGNETYGAGQGREYARFLVETLKPFIDSVYRTKPQKEYTGIMGSSMGGLISLLTALTYPQTFGKVGCLSPAFRYSPNFFSMLDTVPLPADVRMYFLMGELEALSGSADTAFVGDLHLNTFALDMIEVYNTLLRRGWDVSSLYCEVTKGADHNEKFWRSRLSDVLLWLWKD